MSSKRSSLKGLKKGITGVYIGTIAGCVFDRNGNIRIKRMPTKKRRKKND